jgi:hypothetical protein
MSPTGTSSSSSSTPTQSPHSPVRATCPSPHSPGVRSLSLSNRARDNPRCHKCGNDSSVNKLDFWVEQGVWIWHCSAESTVASGSTFCSHKFIEEQHTNPCPECTRPMVIERHRRRYCFWCAECDKYSD